MKILVVHEVSYLRKVVYEIHEFPELLALKGHDITFFEFDEGATRDTLSEPRDRVVSGRIHNQAEIRLLTPHRLGISGLDRIWAIFSSIKPLRNLVKNGKFDVILNYAVPTYGLQVGLLGRFYKVPVLQRALDVASKIRKSIWNPLIALFEKVCFKLATEVSTNNPAMSKYVVELMGGGFANKIVMHYPPLDERIFKQTPRDERLASALGIATTDKVVMYMGSFFYFSGLDDVINNMPEQLLSTPDLKLLLIGGGEQEALLRDLVEKHKLQEKVIFTGFVPFHDLPRYMTLGDVAINPLQVSTVAGAAFPHKVLQYMAVGIPTVSTKLEGLYAAFGDESGIVWTENSPQTLAAAVQALHASEPERTVQIRIQREVLNSKFSVEATTRALEDSLKQLSIGRGK